MWIYTSYYPINQPTTMSGTRIDELFERQNAHGHANNYTTHKGFGSPGAPLQRCEQYAVDAGRAYLQLPYAHAHNSPYVEAVWAHPGAPVGATRLIVNRNDLYEIYFTDDHYRLYWTVSATNNPGPKKL